MKILQINKYLKVVGGAETYMFQLSKALQELGIEVKFWGMEDPENTINDFGGLEAKNVNFQDQNARDKVASVFNTIYSKSNRQKIAQVLDDYKPDIVHIHNYNFQLTPSILPEIKKRNIKVVQTIHDSQMVCPYHRLYNFQRDSVCTKCVQGSFVNCIKDRCFEGSILKSTIGAVESMVYHHKGYYEKYIDTYISPSKFMADLVKNRVHKEIIVIPNFTKTKTNLNQEISAENFYLYYGRISEEKGILELLDVFMENNLQLVIVGKGALDENVNEKIKSSKNISFLGPKYDEDLFNIVKRAKYVIQPSKGFENCPMTVIEAFSLGVPVIGPNHSGFKDLIQDGKTGYLINFNNKSETISRILEIERRDVSFMKKNVSEYYESNLSESIHIDRILKVYNNVLSQ
jgi:glycosyltransferase involved in cell wall biosynthesis